MGMKWTELHLLLSLPGIFHRSPEELNQEAQMKIVDYMFLFSSRDASLLTTKLTLASFLFVPQVHPHRFMVISYKFKRYNVIIFTPVHVEKPCS